MTSQQRRLHRRVVIASMTMVAAGVAEFVLSRFPGPVSLLMPVPVVAALVCSLVMHRTIASMNRASKTPATRSCDCSEGGRQGHSRNGAALVDKQAITTTVVTSNIT